MTLATNRPLVRLAAALTLSTLGAGPLAAAQLEVPEDYPTIQSALDVAQAGDVVLVSKGTYHENVFFHGIGVTLKGKGKVLVKPTSNLPAIQFHNCVDSKIVNLRVDGLGQSIGIKVNSVDDVLVKDCRVKNALGFGIWADLGVGARLVDNKIVDTQGVAIKVRGDYAKVLENRIEDASGDGIWVEGTFHRVEGNRIERATQAGIRLPSGEATQTLIADNRIDETAMVGLYAENLTVGNSILDNRITGSGNQGMLLYGKGQTVGGNKIKESGSEGIFANTTLTQLHGNKVAKSGKSGVWIVAGVQNSLTDNKIRKSTFDGLFVGGSAHTVIQNSMRKSGQLDLNDATGNSLFQGNDYGTSNLP